MKILNQNPIIFPPIGSSNNSEISNRDTHSSQSMKSYKKLKYLGKGSYGAALLVCLRLS